MAFLLLTVAPLMRVYCTPVFSVGIFIIHAVLFIYFACFVVVYFLRFQRASFRLSAIDLLVAFYSVLYFLSCWFSQNGDVSFVAVMVEVPMLLMYLFFRVIQVRGEREGAPVQSLPLLFITMTAAVLSVWGLMQYFLEFDLPLDLKSLFKTHHFPIIASLGNPNFFAEFLTLCLPAVLSFCDYHKKYYLYIPVFFASGLAIFLTYSRLAWAVLFLFGVVSIVICSREGRRWIVAASLCLLITAVSIFMYHHISGSSRAVRIVKSIDRATVFQEREVIYTAGLLMLRDSSFLGMGPGMFEHNYLRYQGLAAENLDRPSHYYQYVDLDHAHCDFLEVGIESGYVALLVFTGLIFFSAAAGIRHIKRCRDGLLKHIGLIPLMFIPFAVWGFPFHLPFSRMLFLFAIANLALPEWNFIPSRAFVNTLFIFGLLIMVSFAAFHTRYILSICSYERGLAHFYRDQEKGLEEFARGIQYFPYNGYNYFSAGALLLNNGSPMGISYSKDSLNYLSSSSTYLNIARGYRDRGMRAEALAWYRQLLFIRPDFKKAREEYRESLDNEDK